MESIEGIKYKVINNNIVSVHWGAKSSNNILDDISIILFRDRIYNLCLNGEVMDSYEWNWHIGTCVKSLYTVLSAEKKVLPLKKAPKVSARVEIAINTNPWLWIKPSRLSIKLFIDEVETSMEVISLEDIKALWHKRNLREK